MQHSILTTDGNVVSLSECNSPEDDFAPAVAADTKTFLWTSNRPFGQQREVIDTKSRFGEKIFFLNEDQWHASAPAQLFTNAMAEKNHGSAATTPDGSELYFGASYADVSIGGTDIYHVKRNGGQWSAPELVKELSSKWWDSHPTISPDGKTIIFASDRGESDPTSETKGSRLPTLWIADMTASGTWSVPRKLPPPIACEAASISPSFSSDGSLYFSTNRFASTGFDIVRSQRTPSGWGPVERLAAPINSASDDVFPCIGADRKSIYFSSDRPGGKGGLDLYSADVPYVIRLRGQVVRIDESGGISPAAGVSVHLLETASSQKKSITTGSDGIYETTLQAGWIYRIEIGSAECYSTTAAAELHTTVPFTLDTTYVQDFSLTRIVFPTFRLERYNIPFFVTGYYYPNTNANLDTLQKRIMRKELVRESGGNTPYIDIADEKYRSYTVRIEQIFDSVYTAIITNILPQFNACAFTTEVLRIEVRGFVDPRGLTYGVYPDKTVQTDETTIQQGSVMAGQEGNRKLANLRAYYTLKMLDEELSRRSDTYRALKTANRIRLHAYGVGIDTETESSRLQDPAKRRIDIRLSIDAADEKR